MVQAYTSYVAVSPAPHDDHKRTEKGLCYVGNVWAHLPASSQTTGLILEAQWSNSLLLSMKYTRYNIYLPPLRSLSNLTDQCIIKRANACATLLSQCNWPTVLLQAINNFINNVCFTVYTSYPNIFCWNISSMRYSLGC